ncbi:hypothetical protein [Oceanobacter mangrovi]|uniref:hypothetical protein n=1 Tax=Oceanobacter mangrovi TaxID=2862510 RepID=UPI001C8E5D37|nr:hypothetical protein [Oceanobacter mangrovi]
MTLFCGAYMPESGLVDSPFVGALTRVAANLTRLPTKAVADASAHLDLYFLLPHGEEIPPFRGMRFHSFDREHMRLRIESSVPAHMLESRHCQAYVLAAIEDALENAAEFFASENIQFDYLGWSSRLRQLARAA